MIIVIIASGNFPAGRFWIFYFWASRALPPTGSGASLEHLQPSLIRTKHRTQDGCIGWGWAISDQNTDMSTWSTRAQKRQMSWWTWPATFTNSSFKATCFALHFIKWQIRTTLLATLARVDRGHPVAGTVHLCCTNPSSVDSYLYLKSALWDPLELPCCTAAC